MGNGYIENGYNNQQNNQSKVDIKAVIEWGFTLVSMIILPLVIWMITLLLSLDKRVSIMEGNRFSSTDGIELMEDISTLQNEVLRIESRISSLEDCQIKIRTGAIGNC